MIQTVKTCFKCEIPKLLSEFDKRGTKYQSWCKLCRKRYHHDYWIKNPHRRKTIKTNNLKLRAEVESKVLEHLRSNPCVECGEDNILTLHFDHLRDKKFNISDGVTRGYTWAKLKAEISKCQILCANCHSIKSSIDNNNWKLRW